MKKPHFVHLLLADVIWMTAATRYGALSGASAAVAVLSLGAVAFRFRAISRGVLLMLGLVTAAAGLSGYRYFLRCARSPKQEEYVRGTFLIDDLRFVPMPGLKMRRYVQAKRLDAGKEEAVVVRIPFQADETLFRRGTVLELSGRLLPRRTAEAIDLRTGETLDARRYDRASRMLLADRAEVAVRRKLPGESFFALRDRLLALAVQNVGSEENRDLAAALFFGVRSQLPSGSRLDFVRSGTIHLLSVSGLHIGMLAAFLLLPLRLFPDRKKYLLLTFLIGVYAVSTGMNPPAQRAFFMIGAYSLLKVLRLYLPNILILESIAAGMLIGDPANLTDMGFDYSFTVTAALLLLAENMRPVHETQRDFLSLFHGREAARERLAGKILDLTVFSALVCLFAFVAGLPLSLYFQGLFLPGAVIANIVLLPVCALLFPLLFLKTAFAAMGADIFAAPFSALLGCLRKVAEYGAENFGCFPAASPGLGGLLTLYVFLSGTMFLRGKRRYLSAVCAAGTLAFLLLSPGNARSHSSVLVIHGGPDGVFSAVVADTLSREAVMVNVPSGSAHIADEFLRGKGIRNLSEVHVSNCRSAFLSDLTRLRGVFPVRRYFLPEGRIRSAPFRGKLEENSFGASAGHSSLCRVSRLPDGETVVTYRNANSGFSFTLRAPESPAGEIVFSSEGKTERLRAFAQNIPYFIEFPSADAAFSKRSSAATE